MIISDTITALTTPPGRGGVAVIRVSGKEAQNIAKVLTQRESFSPRYAHYSPFFDRDGSAIDEGLILFFPAPHSFTGEDVVEIYGHGGMVVVDALLERILALGARMARPGEFSERAFLNDKIDLLQAEAIADLIDSSSRQAARSAMRSLQGKFSTQIELLVEQLTHLRIHLEACLDFPDEEIDVLADGVVQQKIIALQQAIAEVLHCAQQGAIYRDGMTVVISGAPNVGKSTLLNQLSGRETAIVTDIPGTTRDVMREQILVEGIPIHIIDTAGFHESEDIVEQEGIRRARAAIVQADAILWLEDSSIKRTVTAQVQKFPENIPLIEVINKVDLLPAPLEESQANKVYISAKTGYGIEQLRQRLQQLAGGSKDARENSFSARQRHLEALQRTQNVLQQCEKQLVNREPVDLIAEDLRQAQDLLGEITGTVTSEDLLGHIFSSFCIGK